MFGSRLIIIASLIALFTLCGQLYLVQLYDMSFFTGWTLVGVAALIVLALFARNAHSKPNPALKSFYYSTHVVLGWFMLYVFLLHIEFSFPQGIIEIGMTILFFILCISGIFGRARHYFKQLKQNHKEVNVPLARKELRDEVNQIVAEPVLTQGDDGLMLFYDRELKTFFETVPPRLKTLFYHRTQAKKVLRRIQHEVKEHPEFKTSLDQLRKLVNKKSNVEYQYAMNKVLTSWSIIHRVVTYSMIMFVVLHIILVYVFTG